MPKKLVYFQKQGRLKMKVTSMKMLPNIVSLNLDTAKNSNILHAGKSNFIGLIFLQGTQVCA